MSLRSFSPASALASVILETEPPALWLLSGGRKSGKSSACQALAAAARVRGYGVGGVLCPAVFSAGRKSGMELLSLATGERRALGVRRRPSCGGVRVGSWCLDAAALAWGNALLRQGAGADLLIIDELGPLEFSDGGGFQQALQILDRGNYQRAVVVIRPELLAVAQARWPRAALLAIEKGEL